MTIPCFGPARGWARLSSAIVLGLLCAAAVLIVLDPPSHAAATALPLALAGPPPAAPGAPQTVTATLTVNPARGPIHYLTGTLTPVELSPQSSSGAHTAMPASPQSGGIKYDNTTTPHGGFFQGPAVQSGSNRIGLMYADDITLSQNVDGLHVSKLSFSVFNNNVSAVSARVNLRFWYDDGVNGQPGTYFKNAGGSPVSYTYGPVSFAPGQTLLNGLTVPSDFTFPAGRTTLWAGIAFDDNNGTSGATLAQIGNLGQEAYDPPTVGSSADHIFGSNAQGSFYNTSNPTGTLQTFGGGSPPVANLYWRFEFANICPTLVTTIMDSVAGSLRSALACATPGDTVTFAVPANSVIALASGELTVTKAITIDGSTAVNLAVSGNNISRVFSMTAPVSIISLTVMNGNAGAGAGGGLYTTSILTLTNVVVLSNTAGSNGGGALVYGATTLTNGLFQNNHTNGGGGGGGLYAHGTLTLTGTQFIDNTAIGGGGGALATGAATLNGGLFQNNHSKFGSGGGLFALGTLALTGTQLLGNSASSGGGVYQSVASSGDSRLVNGLFARNVATNTTGAALYLGSSGTVEILFSTIGSQAPDSGAAIYLDSGTVGITDTIVASYSTGISNAGGTVYEDYNLFFGDTISQTGTIHGGAHDVSGDPRFVNAANDDYHLRVGSAAIDKGVDAGVYTDLEGVVRPQGGGFDVGAYEAILKRLFLPLIRR